MLTSVLIKRCIPKHLPTSLFGDAWQLHLRAVPETKILYIQRQVGKFITSLQSVKDEKRSGESADRLLGVSVISIHSLF